MLVCLVTVPSSAPHLLTPQRQQEKREEKRRSAERRTRVGTGAVNEREMSKCVLGEDKVRKPDEERCRSAQDTKPCVDQHMIA